MKFKISFYCHILVFKCLSLQQKYYLQAKFCDIMNILLKPKMAINTPRRHLANSGGGTALCLYVYLLLVPKCVHCENCYQFDIRRSTRQVAIYIYLFRLTLLHIE